MRVPVLPAALILCLFSIQSQASSSLYFLQTIGESGTANGQFQFSANTSEPGKIVFSGNCLYVTDWSNGRIQRFNADGTFKDWLGQVGGSWGFRTSGTPADASLYRSQLFVDSTGNLYFQKENVIEKHDSTGALTGTFSNIVTYTGKSFTLDASGNFFAVGTGNNSINKYNASGTLVATFGSQGTGNGQFNNIGERDILCDSAGNVYMPDVGGKRIQKFSNTGSYLAKWSVDIDTVVMAIDEQNRIYVIENWGSVLRQYSSSGVLQAEYDISGIVSPIPADSQICVRNGKLYVNRVYDSYANTVRVYSLTAPSSLAAPAAPSGLAAYPVVGGIALDWLPVPNAETFSIYRATSSGGPYTDVTSSVTLGRSRAYDTAALTPGATYYYKVYSRNYGGSSASAALASATVPAFPTKAITLLKSIGQTGTASGQFNFNYNITTAGSLFVDGSYLYVTDWGNSRLQRFTPTGTFKDMLGRIGSIWGYFSSGYSLGSVNCYAPFHVDGAGNVYLQSAGAIQKHNSGGDFVAIFSSMGLPSTKGQPFTMDAAGNFFVTGSNSDSISKYNSSGTLMTKIGGFGTGDGRFCNAGNLVSIRCDSQGNVYMLDSGRGYVHKFSNAGVFLAKWPVDIWGSALMAIDEQDCVYVLENWNWTLRRYNSTGVLQAEYAVNGAAISGASDLFVRSGKLYISNAQNTNPNTVQIYTMPNVYILSAAASIVASGAVTGAGSYDPGATAVISAVPNAGYVFQSWSGDYTGTDNPASIAMNANKTVTAVFAPDTADNDGDGLTNYQEAVIYQSDLNSKDTNNDGLQDGAAVLLGFLPTDNKSALVSQLNSNTGKYGLYTAQTVQDLNLGGVTIQKTGTAVTVHLELQTSGDLQTWTSGTAVDYTVPMPGNKGFLRVQARGNQ